MVSPAEGTKCKSGGLHCLANFYCLRGATGIKPFVHPLRRLKKHTKHRTTQKRTMAGRVDRVTFFRHELAACNCALSSHKIPFLKFVDEPLENLPRHALCFLNSFTEKWTKHLRIPFCWTLSRLLPLSSSLINCWRASNFASSRVGRITFFEQTCRRARPSAHLVHLKMTPRTQTRPAIKTNSKL